MRNFFFLSFLLLSACSSASESACDQLTSEEARQVVVDYFRAISEKDPEGLQRLSTSDYVLYEAGAIWNNDSLITAINSMPQATIVYEFSDIEVETDCNSAFLNYRNHGTLTTPDTTMHFYWVESALVKRVGEEYLLDFLHSTVAK